MFALFVCAVVCWADTLVCPYGCWCFFVVVVGANRCVRSFLRCCCLLGRPMCLPLRLWVFFVVFCRGEPVCSPLLLHCCCFVVQTRQSAPSVLVFFVVVVGANRRVRPFLRGVVYVGQTHWSAPSMLYSKSRLIFLWLFNFGNQQVVI